MTTHRHGPPRAAPRRITACAAAVALLVAGCTSTTTTADDPTRATASKSPTAPTPSVLDISPSPNSPNPREGLASSLPATSPNGTAGSPDPAAQEAADRAAIEGQWVKFWEIYRRIARTPEADRPALLHTVAMDPSYSAALKDGENLTDEGLDTYGDVIHHVSWPIPIEGNDNATIADCMDQSNAGNYVVVTNEKHSVGVAANNIRGAMSRGSDGIWRVNAILYLTDQPC